MSAKAILLFSLVFYFVPGYTQEAVIKCSSVRNPDNSISVFSESQFYGVYTVKLTFSEWLGYTTSSYMMGDMVLAPVEFGKQEIFRAAMTKSAPSYAFRYRYTYFPGKVLEKAPDSTLLYLLPANAGSSLRISNVSSIAERLGQKQPEGYSATGFVFKLGDTLCAARGGLVYDCNDAVKDGEKTEEFFKSTRNKINIQHRDGSISIYEILAPIQLLVKPGDDVFPGTALAVFNKESEKYMLLLSAFYLDKKKVMQPADETSTRSSFSYIHMHFYTGEQSIPLEVNKQYAVTHPKDIVSAEMTKKQKKKLGF